MLLHTLPKFLKLSRDNFADVLGEGVTVIKSKPRSIRFEIFLAPTSVICFGGYATQTNNGLKPSLSLTQCACLVLSLPALTPTIQS